MNKHVTILTTYFLLSGMKTDVCLASPLNMSWYHWPTPTNIEQEQLIRCMSKQGNNLPRLSDRIRKAYLDQLFTCIGSNLNPQEKQETQKPTTLKDPFIRASDRYRMRYGIFTHIVCNNLITQKIHRRVAKKLGEKKLWVPLMNKMENSSDVPGLKWPILLIVQILSYLLQNWSINRPLNVTKWCQIKYRYPGKYVG